MNFVGSAVLFFFLVVYGTLAVALMVRAVAGIVNDFRTVDPEAEINKKPNYNGAVGWVSPEEERHAAEGSHFGGAT